MINFIVLDEEDKRLIAEDKIVSCRLRDNSKISIVSEKGYDNFIAMSSQISDLDEYLEGEE